MKYKHRLATVEASSRWEAWTMFIPIFDDVIKMSRVDYIPSVIEE